MEHLTRWLSHALEAHEREVVLGDLRESNASQWTCFKQVLGLVVRRQLPRWLALTALLPIILLLSSESVSQAVAMAMKRLNPVALLLGMIEAWIAGYVLARLMRDAVWSGLVVTLAVAATAAWTSAHHAWKYLGAISALRLAIPAVCFLAPLILAALAASRGWTHGRKTTAALLIAMTLAFINLGTSAPILEEPVLLALMHWPLLYIMWNVGPSSAKSHPATPE